MFPADRQALQAPVVIEYDSRASQASPRGARVRKVLPNAYAARAFYAKKLKAGRDPTVVAKQGKVEQ